MIKNSAQDTRAKSEFHLTQANKNIETTLRRFLSGILMMPLKPVCIVPLIVLMIFIYIAFVSAYQLEGVRWPQPSTAFYVDIPGADGLWNTSFETAMAYWGVDTVFEYRIARGEYEDPCDPPEGRNGVGFQPSDCGDAWGNTTLATTHYFFTGSTLFQADIVFNSNEFWNVYSTSWESDEWAGINDFQRVAVHELGHALGLGHEDSGVATIMASHPSDITIPQADDIKGVTAIYEKNIITPSPNNGDREYSPPSGGGGGCFIATAAFG